MAGLKDIADRLSVSQSLVSKVLNNRLGTTLVRPELAEKIRQTAAEVGYQKNRSAAALTKGRRAAFGVFIHRLGAAGSSLTENLLEGISREANRRHQTLSLDFFQTNAEFSQLTHSSRRGSIDGLVLAGVPHPGLSDSLQALAAGGLPVVTILDTDLHPAIPNVGIDQAYVGYLATKHLLDQGCRRIAEVAVNPHRHRGYLRALEEAGLAADPTLTRNPPTAESALPYNRERANAILRSMLDDNVAFDGFFAHWDEQAMDAQRALLTAGRRLPDDVKLASVDNSPYCDLAMVPISSVSQNNLARGQAAVNLLLDHIDGKAVASTTVEPELKFRASSHR